MKEIRNTTNKALQKSLARLDKLIKDKAPDTDIISARLDVVMSDKDLIKKALIGSGIYDKNLKLTKHYR